MSVNSSTYLQLKSDEATIGTDNVVRFTTSDTYVHSLVIGVKDDSASATTGNWVGASDVTAANKKGAKITATSPLSVATIANDRGTLPVNLADYYVAGASGDTVYCVYLEEVAKT